MGIQQPQTVEVERSIWDAANLEASDDFVAKMKDVSNRDSEIPMHAHTRGQLLHVRRGVIVVGTATATYTLPPGRAIWLPPQVPHWARYPQASSMGTIFFEKDAIAWDNPADVQIYRLDELSTALLNEATKFAFSATSDKMQYMTLVMLVTRMEKLDDRGLSLPEGHDPRLRLATRWLRNNPTDREDLDTLSRFANCSRRTLYRLFDSELGMTPGIWRRHMRMSLALQMLATGAPVSKVAGELGFTNPGNFSATFKSIFGKSPSAFFS
ncbi:Arabinose operon regulatory protein [Shimia sp. SK013]|uniref:AraC family transcriptional regulator n=1 Tax=Shimia sp. SK013 TaxID=1389006 RepID=UPI0006B418E5|nr:helix-turn-helix transcriptional regulator [Shimia sp. SK013]KPA21285.1 Arabinose operon regulatory protein [Shimia sp. SK013]